MIFCLAKKQKLIIGIVKAQFMILFSASVLTCKRALIVSIGFVIKVVVNPARTPETLCKNKSEVFTGHLFSSFSKCEQIRTK